MAAVSTLQQSLLFSLSLCLTAARSQSSAVAAFTTSPHHYYTHHHNNNIIHHPRNRNLRNFCVVNMAKKKSGGGDSGQDNIGTGGVMMILSPAKTLDLTPFSAPDSDSFPQSLSAPNCDVAKTKVVALAMKARSKKDLEKLLGISANLAAKSHQYWNDFDTPGSLDKPAIYAFSGAAYQGLDVSTCSGAAVHYIQQNLRIIDPLYGSLRPLDSIQPYRLEMATKKALDANTMSGCKDLANWWKPAVTLSISEDLQNREEKILINVASDEYSAAVDASLLPDGSRYIKIVFRQEGKVIAVHAKKARGMMVRYLAENNIQDVDGIRQFDMEGYQLVESDSSDDIIIFDRPKQAAAAAAKKKKKPATNKKADGPKKKRARST
mmetsp:Transcript_36184/g.66410  ORF Transcript_36184/g.66410 Transcript_36184/m.66410 type:complete len:379 (+) Transcript_36184:93-1229(+)